jgi:transposase
LDKVKITDRYLILVNQPRKHYLQANHLPFYCSEMNPIELEWLPLKRDHRAGQMFDSEDNLIWGLRIV